MKNEKNNTNVETQPKLKVVSPPKKSPLPRLIKEVNKMIGKNKE